VSAAESLLSLRRETILILANPACIFLEPPIELPCFQCELCNGSEEL
jgi:hypothetical protein